MFIYEFYRYGGMEVVLISAIARNQVIGRRGTLPWHLPSDLRRFKQLTLGSPVIMGRGTFDSIVNSLGGPLPGRLNIVLTRNMSLQSFPGVAFCDDIEKALEVASKYPKVFIIGGQKIYEQFMEKDLVDRLELTLLDKDVEGDAYFPEINFNEWKLENKEELQENGFGISFVSYSRNKELNKPIEIVKGESKEGVDLKSEIDIKIKPKRRALFVAFEGLDGSGKSTQARKLAEYLFKEDKYNHVILTREPFKDISIRDIIKGDSNPMDDADKLADLFIADRKRHVDELIQPGLDSGCHVITDRYRLATIAYQSAQGLSIKEMIERHEGLPVPDLTFIVDVSPETAIKRMANEIRGREHKFEKSSDFLGKIRGQMIKAIELLEDENIFIVNGEREIDEIFEEIKTIVTRKLLEVPSTGLDGVDNEVFNAIKRETKRQQKTINLIPSENYASKAVMEACGTSLMNKYAEGYPLKRYYQGNKFVDSVELLAIERAKKIFGAEHVNVQSYSGSPANLAILLAFLKPGETFMGLDLACGGHLTHGSPVNASGLLYNVVSYGVDKQTNLIDMGEVRRIALEKKPKLIISGLTAYPRQIDFKKFQDIAEEVGAIHVADISHIAGLVAAGVHQSPFPFTDIVMTTTHKTLRGPRGAMIMCKEKYAKQIDKAVFPGMQGGPHMNVIAGKAVAFKEALAGEFKEYGNQIIKNAKILADTLMQAGIKLVTNGTDNHLILIDLTPLGIGKGKEIAVALEEAGIVTNANSVPYDPSTPFKPSGLRIGTPMVTTRGFKENEMILLGKWIASVIKNPSDSMLKSAIKQDVEALCDKFPIYGD
jgi:glycine hydroxymethyltransferase